MAHIYGNIYAYSFTWIDMYICIENYNSFINCLPRALIKTFLPRAKLPKVIVSRPHIDTLCSKNWCEVGQEVDVVIEWKWL